MIRKLSSTNGPVFHRILIDWTDIQGKNINFLHRDWEISGKTTTQAYEGNTNELRIGKLTKLKRKSCKPLISASPS